MKKMLLPLAGLAIAMILLPGCASLQDSEIDGEPITDEGVQALANSRLDSDSITGRWTLDAVVEDGLGILYGGVPDEATRLRALSILESTPGVYEVLDRTRKR